MRVLYFAWLRERVGSSFEEVDPPASIETAGDLAQWLAQKGPNYALAFEDLEALQVAVDQEHASMQAPIANAAEVAFFPPVTGG